MATLRRFTDSPAYHRLVNLTAAVGSGLTAYIGYDVLKDEIPAVSRWWAGPMTILLLVGSANYLIKKAYNRLAQSEISFQETFSRSVENRLDELERLKRRDLVTPEEYAAKRQEILKDL
jgi:hypothetical protein